MVKHYRATSISMAVELYFAADTGDCLKKTLSMCRIGVGGGGKSMRQNVTTE